MPQEPDNSPLHQDVRTEAGFARFVRETQARLRAFLRSKGLRPPDADDLAQEAYLTLWKRRADARNPPFLPPRHRQPPRAGPPPQVDPP